MHAFSAVLASRYRLQSRRRYSVRRYFKKVLHPLGGREKTRGHFHSSIGGLLAMPSLRRRSRERIFTDEG